MVGGAINRVQALLISLPDWFDAMQRYLAPLSVRGMAVMLSDARVTPP